MSMCSSKNRDSAMSLEDLLTRSKVQVYGYVKSNGVIRTRAKRLMLVTTGLLHVYRSEMKPDDTAMKRLLITCDTVLTVYDPCDASKNRHMLLMHGPKDKLNVFFENAYDQGRLIKALTEEGAKINDPKSRLIYEEFLASTATPSNLLPNLSEDVNKEELKFPSENDAKDVAGSSNTEKKDQKPNLYQNDVLGSVNLAQNAQDDKEHHYNKLSPLDTLSGDAFIDSLEDVVAQDQTYATTVQINQWVGQLDDLKESDDPKEGELPEPKPENQESAPSKAQDVSPPEIIPEREAVKAGGEIENKFVAKADEATNSNQPSDSAELTSNGNAISESAVGINGESEIYPQNQLSTSEVAETAQTIVTINTEIDQEIKENNEDSQNSIVNLGDENAQESVSSDDSTESLISTSSRNINQEPSNKDGSTEVSEEDNATEEVESNVHPTLDVENNETVHIISNEFSTSDLPVCEAINENVHPHVEDFETGGSRQRGLSERPEREESIAHTEVINFEERPHVNRTSGGISIENHASNDLNKNTHVFHSNEINENKSTVVYSGHEKDIPIAHNEGRPEGAFNMTKSNDNIPSENNSTPTPTPMKDTQKSEPVSPLNEDSAKQAELDTASQLHLEETELEFETSEENSGAIFIAIVEPEDQSEMESIYSDIEMMNERAALKAAGRCDDLCDALPYTSLKDAAKAVNEIISGKIESLEEFEYEVGARNSHSDESSSEVNTHARYALKNEATELGTEKLLEKEGTQTKSLPLRTENETDLGLKTHEDNLNNRPDLNNRLLNNRHDARSEEVSKHETSSIKTYDSASEYQTEDGRNPQKISDNSHGRQEDSKIHTTTVADDSDLLDVFTKKITDAFKADDKFLSDHSRADLLGFGKKQMQPQDMADSHISIPAAESSSELELTHRADLNLVESAAQLNDSFDRETGITQASDREDASDSSVSLHGNYSPEALLVLAEQNKKDKFVRDKMLVEDYPENIYETIQYDNADDSTVTEEETTDEIGSLSKTDVIHNGKNICVGTGAMTNARIEGKNTSINEDGSNFAEAELETVHSETKVPDKPILQSSLKKVRDKESSPMITFEEKMGWNMTVKTVRFDDDVNKRFYDPSSDSAESVVSHSESEDDQIDEYWGWAITSKRGHGGGDEETSGNVPETNSAENETNSAENETYSTENETNSAENETYSDENGTYSAENESKSAENETKSAENETNSAENETSSENETKSAENPLETGSQPEDSLSELIELSKTTTHLFLDLPSFNDDFSSAGTSKSDSLASATAGSALSPAPEGVETDPVTSVKSGKAVRSGVKKIPVLMKFNEKETGRTIPSSSSSDSDKCLCMVDLAGDDRNFYKRFIKVEEGHLLVLRAPKTLPSTPDGKLSNFDDSRVRSLENDVILSKVDLRCTTVQPGLRQSNSGLYNVSLKPPHHSKINLQFQTRDEQMKYTFLLSDEVVKVTPSDELPALLYPSRAEKLKLSSLRSPNSGEKSVSNSSSATSSENKTASEENKDFRPSPEVNFNLYEKVEPKVSLSFKTDRIEKKSEFLKSIVSGTEIQKASTHNEIPRNSSTRVKIPDAFSNLDSQILFRHVNKKASIEKNTSLENKAEAHSSGMTQVQVEQEPALMNPSPNLQSTPESRLASSRETPAVAQTDEQTSVNRRLRSSTDGARSKVRKQRRVSAPLLIDQFKEEYFSSNTAEKTRASSFRSKTSSTKLPFDGHVNAMKKVFEKLSDDVQELDIHNETSPLHRKYSLGSRSKRFEMGVKRVYFTSPSSAADNKGMPASQRNEMNNSRPRVVRQTSLTTGTGTSAPDRTQEPRRGVGESSMSQSQLRRQLMMAKMELAALETERSQLVDRGNAICRQLIEPGPGNELE